MASITARMLGTKKSAVTRCHTSCSKMYKATKASAPQDLDHARSEAKSNLSALTLAYGEYLETHQKYVALETTDDPTAEAEETALDTYSEKNDEARNWLTEILDIIAKIERKRFKENEEANQTLNSSMVGQTTQSVVMNNVIPDYLQPEKLSHEANLEEFRSWKQQFISFYKSSETDKKDDDTKMAVAQKALDKNLWQALTEAGVGSKTPILGDTGLLATLETIIMDNYPLFNRRLAFFEAAQAQGQKMSAFRNSLHQKMKDGEVEKMTWQDHLAFRLITACRDSKLMNKFYKLKDPMTLDDVKKAIKDYENEQKHGEKSKTHVNHVSQQRGRSEKKTQKPKGQKSRSQSRPGTGTTCGRCGKPNHSANECYAKPCPKCRKCGLFCVCKKDNGGEKSHHVTKLVSMADNVVASLNSSQLDRISVSISSKTSRTFKFKAIPDSGASTTIISTKLAKSNNLHKDRDCDRKLFTANMTEMKNDGLVDITLECEGHTIETTAVLSKDLRDDVLISKRDCKRLGILPEDFPKPQHGNCQCDNYENFNKAYEELLEDFAPEKPPTLVPEIEVKAVFLDKKAKEKINTEGEALSSTMCLTTN